MRTEERVLPNQPNHGRVVSVSVASLEYLVKVNIAKDIDSQVFIFQVYSMQAFITDAALINQYIIIKFLLFARKSFYN